MCQTGIDQTRMESKDANVLSLKLARFSVSFITAPFETE